MKKIDAHQHFWKYDPQRDIWMTEKMDMLHRDFMPPDLIGDLAKYGFEGTVLVQSSQTEEENAFQLQNAAENNFIKGVVGWIDLTSAEVPERLGYYSRFPKMKGFRHTLQDEPQRDYMLRPDFLRGLAALAGFGYTYDILVYPDQLPFIPQMVTRFPNQKFVIDHLAKPYIKDRKISEWEQDIRAVSAYRNVYCKMSGYTTEADWQHWVPGDFTRYFDVVVDAFGTDRLMVGSDWPVCLLAGTYGTVTDVVFNYFSPFSDEEKEAVFGNNAAAFYNLQI